MNPENQPNQQKPNLERIAELILPEWASLNKSGFSLPHHIIQKNWENIEKGKISYPDNPHLEDLLKQNEYHLEALLPDFKFLGYYFSKWFVAGNTLFSMVTNQIPKFEFELIQALHYLHENKQVEIQIKSLKKKGGILIQNPDIIQIISGSLFEYFKENDISFEMGKNPEDISDWGAYIKERFAEEKSRTSKRGRKKGIYQIKRITFFLWKYLQEYTDIKAEAGAGYSNEQARFIFSFLEIYGLIENPDLLTRKEDIIAYYLKSYKQSRIKNQNLQSGK